MRVLVTNDDGIDSAGLHALARMAVAAGHDVVVAAPASEASGASASIQAVDVDGRIIVDARALPDLDGVPAHAVAATPAFIVLLATRSAFGPPPELVLSGINLGANTGAAVLYSGTVGAALAGLANGCRAMAVSLDVGLDVRGERRWDTAAEVAAELLPLVTGRERGFVLNVNVPNRARSELRGVRRARLATFGVVQMTMLERGTGWVKMSLQPNDADLEPGTDEALLVEGYATATPIRASQEAEDVALSGLADEVRR
jgi:5'-nucleotidase